MAGVGAGEPEPRSEADGDADRQPRPEPGDGESDTEGEPDPDADGWADGAEWAGARRDRLLGALYSRLFTWLVNAVNARLKVGGEARPSRRASARPHPAPPQAPAGEAPRRCSLGILDVYGLESLAYNGLERLLINYAAERVQAAVTGATLRREQDEYAREGLAWAPLRYTDHELSAESLDAVSAVAVPSPLRPRPPDRRLPQGPDSVLGALRECSLRAGACDAEFLQRLQRRRPSRLLVLPPHHFQ